MAKSEESWASMMRAADASAGKQKFYASFSKSASKFAAQKASQSAYEASGSTQRRKDRTVSEINALRGYYHDKAMAAYVAGGSKGKAPVFKKYRNQPKRQATSNHGS